MRLAMLLALCLTFSAALAEDPQPEAKKDAKSADSGTQCAIKKCDFRYSLDAAACECREWAGPTCRIKCPDGSKIFALPWIVNCKCEKAPECAIEECRQHAQLADCKCAPKEKAAEGAEKEEKPKEAPEDDAKDE